MKGLTLLCAEGPKEEVVTGQTQRQSSAYDFAFQRGGHVSLTPGWGAKIPQASRPKNSKIRQKQCCSKLNKDFKNCPH